MHAPPYTAHRLDLDSQELVVWAGTIPESLRAAIPLEPLWNLHPELFPVINLFGPKPLPRWQQAFGKDYSFSAQTSKAAAIPALLEPLLEWTRHAIDARLNGLLLNWYEGERRHYIGAHHDSTKGLVAGSPIVTISFGASRTFRFSRIAGDGKREIHDFRVDDGSVLIIPMTVNEFWKHEVPHFKSDTGRRVSVTIRAFSDGEGTEEPRKPVRSNKARRAPSSGKKDTATTAGPPETSSPRGVLPPNPAGPDFEEAVVEFENALRAIKDAVVALNAVVAALEDAVAALK